jgi:branched-chain amino acid transport system substrate-binding protein
MVHRLPIVLIGLGLLVAPAAAADVVIGVAAPLSGAFAPVGREIAAGVRLAADRLNEEGGIDGETVVVEELDDKCAADTGAAVANQFVGRGAVLVVGHACTAAALPAAAVYAGSGIVHISPAATNPRFTDERAGPAVFRLAPRSDAQAGVIAAFLADRFAGRRVAFVHDGSVYGQGFVDAVRGLYEAAGNQAAATRAFTPGEDSQNALAGELQDGVVDAVVIGGLQADAAVIASEIRARGLDALIIGNESLGLEEFRDLAGPAAEGVVFSVPEAEATGPVAPSLVAALAAEGIDPPGAALPAHAAVEAWAGAVAAAGSVEAGAVSAMLRERVFDTVVGRVGFDAKGDRTTPGWRLMTWGGGAPVPLP